MAFWVKAWRLKPGWQLFNLFPECPILRRRRHGGGSGVKNIGFAAVNLDKAAGRGALRRLSHRLNTTKAANRGRDFIGCRRFAMARQGGIVQTGRGRRGGLLAAGQARHDFTLALKPFLDTIRVADVAGRGNAGGGGGPLDFAELAGDGVLLGFKFRHFAVVEFAKGGVSGSCSLSRVIVEMSGCLIAP